jgi:hypothetical protein
MKLRIRDNSLRVRLDRREIDTLAETGRVDAFCRFGAGIALRYCVIAHAQAEDLAAEFSDDEIRICIRPSAVSLLALTETVGVESRQSVGEGEELRLLLEKDFQCLTDRPGEDDSHAFDNPLAGHTCAAHKPGD